MNLKYSIYPSTSFSSVPKEVSKLHLVRPVSFKKLKKFLNNRSIEEISLSESTHKRLCRKSRKLLDAKNVQLIKDSRRGRAIELSFDTVLKINDYRKDYLSVRKIEELTGIPKSTIHYLLKYADRNKIRKGNQTIYLE